MKVRWYQNMSNLIDAEYYLSKSLRFLYMNFKSFNVQKVTEEAKIMISLVSGKVQSEKEWPGVSYEFRTLSCILKPMFPVAWKPKETLEIFLSWRFYWCSDWCPRGKRNWNMSYSLSEKKEGIRFFGNHEIPWLFASIINIFEVDSAIIGSLFNHSIILTCLKAAVS